ncbi:hypothetical protein [Streptomyces sp. NPDC050145]|uniref:hypothetical protein n=1 Tax=Streptomyces sp. NPDC050145 TaxID=3365602 RepID=UPI00379178A0
MVAHRFEAWPARVVTAVAGVLGDTAQGLTGREIGQLLAAVRVPDAEGGNKRDWLAAALLTQQARQRAANCMIAFINAAMAVARLFGTDPTQPGSSLTEPWSPLIP